MNSDQEKLKSLLERIANKDAAPLTSEEQAWLDDFRSRYPFFSLTAEDPSHLCGPQSHARLDKVDEAGRFDGFYPPDEQAATPSTMAAIDDFLNTYGHQSAEEDALIERLIFNPIPDYAQQLAAEEQGSLPAAPDADADSRDARIDRFIRSQKMEEAGENHDIPQATQPTQVPQAAQVPQGAQIPQGNQGVKSHQDIPATPESNVPQGKSRPEAPKSEKPGLLSESLAKIYIKTHRYERAYEILNDLSLRFPEKSRYFADQLRFLRKLILNEQQLRAENAGKTN